MASLPGNRVWTSIVFHPTLNSNDFLEMVMLDFGIAEISPSKAQRLVRLESFLLQGHQQGKICTLIVDEAHKLSPRLLEEIRLLGNFDHAGQKLLQILLIGQTELDEMLNRNDLRQFKQRIAVRLSIHPLDIAEVNAYIRFRWKKSGGGDALPFSGAAMDEIARLSQGLPRVINAMCDNALLLAFAEGSRTVQASQIQESAADLHLLHNFGIAKTAPGAEATPLADAPGPLRIPPFASAELKPSLLSRWAQRLRLGTS
jgi:general secretion pathway protein A